MESIKDLRLAVLIDADNIPAHYVKEMLQEIAKYGTPTFKRIYADFTKPSMTNWKKVLLENSITPIQQYSYTTGKNSSDSAMIIDAMDILYSGKVDGFCIVSSDSDFTRLATRLREAGMKVIGIGERKTLTPMISACDKFIYLEILKAGEDVHEEQKPKPVKAARNIKKQPGKTEEAPKQEESIKSEETTAKGFAPVTNPLIRTIANSINDIADEEGWVFLGDLGNLILKKHPDFDPRNYGFKKLLLLIKRIGLFEIDERDTGKGNVKHVYVRNKQTSNI
ncbi:NYN domain-containing protein [Aridibaculum aurantiacum]|uniref:NYN domain-containing protein n=1 Tax=Aridibaculum aurantiacum TaxID=2810307 RepID=UPI001A95BB78|nr:NYN domain-containing protein [Aridibaculum aurantiacum]